MCAYFYYLAMALEIKLANLYNNSEHLRREEMSVPLFAVLCSGVTAFGPTPPTNSSAPVFSDVIAGGVLQHGVETAVWGSSKPVEALTLTLGGSKSFSMSSDKDGKWKLILPPQQISWKTTLTVSAADGSHATTVVSFGVVVMCAGQSNSKCGEKYIIKAKHPALGTLHVCHHVAQAELEAVLVFTKIPVQ